MEQATKIYFKKLSNFSERYMNSLIFSAMIGVEWLKMSLNVSKNITKYSKSV